MIPRGKMERDGEEREILSSTGEVMLTGTLLVPREPRGIVLFANGSGSSSRSPRNRYVAEVLQSQGMATFLFDLLTRGEEFIDQRTEQLRFDIGLLARRLCAVSESLRRDPDVGRLTMGYFGASTGAAAALVAAGELPEAIAAIVSRGGRPDLAVRALRRIRAPTLLIVGGEDKTVIQWNRKALAQLRCSEKDLIVIPGATHLFEEPGALEEVAGLAAAWFERFLAPMSAPMPDADCESAHTGRES